jgi:hypothetical protein
MIDSECRAVPHRKPGAPYADSLKPVAEGAAVAAGDDDEAAGHAAAAAVGEKVASEEKASDTTEAAEEEEEEEEEEEDGRVNGVVLVPFWAGSAMASGGNSHSEASAEAKHQQAAGTVRVITVKVQTEKLSRTRCRL